VSGDPIWQVTLGSCEMEFHTLSLPLYFLHVSEKTNKTNKISKAMCRFSATTHFVTPDTLPISLYSTNLSNAPVYHDYHLIIGTFNWSPANLAVSDDDVYCPLKRLNRFSVNTPQIYSSPIELRTLLARINVTCFNGMS